MEFEFDQSKSSSNKKKHGIDFVEAQQLWDDPDRVEIPARDTDEPRFLVIGKIVDKHWPGSSHAGASESGSFRFVRSREEEMELYEG